MKKIILLLIIGLVVICIVNFNKAEEQKVSYLVYSALENSDNINIVVQTRNKLVSMNIDENELEVLENDRNIKKIEYSPKFHTLLQNSAIIINATNTWPLKVSGTNITGIQETVCVIDTWVNFSHPNLIGKNKTCVIDCFNKECIENCSISENSGHGTHVAGIVAASSGINGIAPDSNLIGLKVLDSNGDGSAQGTIDIKNAIQWCVNNRLRYNISVISMSLGTDSVFSAYCDGDFPNTLTVSSNNATYYNISMVAASGNSGSSALIAAPACLSNATAVGATNKDDSIASYSDYNSLVQLLAPGTNINSTWKSGYYEDSGTSMATPHIAGAIALVRQFYLLQSSKILTPIEIKNTLKNTGKNITSSGLNFTRINIYQALSSLDNGSPSLNTDNLTSDYYTNINNINFTFVSLSRFNPVLKNISFYLYNSTSLIYNYTRNISGKINSTIFNYTFSKEGTYNYSCFMFNNNSYPANISNYSITYDVTSPNVTLNIPDDGTSGTTSAYNFTFNVSENYSVSCNLILDGVSVGALTNASKTGINGIYYSLAVGGHSWKINCTDAAGNIGSSDSRSLTVETTTPPVTPSSGGGGGGGRPVVVLVNESKTYVAGSRISEGYTQNLEKDDKISFIINNEQHSLKVSQILSSIVVVEISSNPFITQLKVGEEVKLDLNSDWYNDLYVRLNSIINGIPSITVKEIKEQVTRPVNEINNTANINAAATGKSYISTTSFIIIVVLIIILAVSLIVNNLKQRKLGKSRKRTR